MSLTQPRLQTAEDLLALGSHFHGELIKGRIIEMAPAGWGHGLVASNIGMLVGEFVKRNRLGAVVAAETGFTLERDPDTVRAPDFAFVRTDRIPVKNRDKFFEGAPDFAVEVLSPGNRPSEVEDKLADYLRTGVRLVWVVDPIEKTVVVHRPNANPISLTMGERAEGYDVLPGLVIELSQLFE